MMLVRAKKKKKKHVMRKSFAYHDEVLRTEGAVGRLIGSVEVPLGRGGAGVPKVIALEQVPLVGAPRVREVAAALGSRRSVAVREQRHGARECRA